jgi:hypothetical protein
MWHLTSGEIIYRPKAIVINTIQYPANLFNQEESILNDLGIFTLTEVHPPLGGTHQRYSNPVDNFKAHTRTYPVVDKTQAELDNEANSASANTVRILRVEAEVAEMDKLIHAAEATEESVAYTAALTERAIKFAEEIEEMPVETDEGK